MPINENFRSIAAGVVQSKKGDLVRAHFDDHVIDRMRYMKFGDGWGKGDAVYACNARTGNCTDFHSYSIALARAAGIPARFAIGVAIPSERHEGGVDGYHGWAEKSHAEGKWWPVDISEGNTLRAWPPIILAIIRPIAWSSAGPAIGGWNRGPLQVPSISWPILSWKSRARRSRSRQNALFPEGEPQAIIPAPEKGLPAAVLLILRLPSSLPQKPPLLLSLSRIACYRPVSVWWGCRVFP